MITIKNYHFDQNTINWSKMPQAVQDNREGVEEIMEFYDDDADIKETVDIFFKQINDNSKPVGEIIVAKLPKIDFVDPKKNEFESLNNGDIYTIINPRITFVWINPDGYDERMVPQKELKYTGKSNTNEDYKRFVDADEFIYSLSKTEFLDSIKEKLIEKKKTSSSPKKPTQSKDLNLIKGDLLEMKADKKLLIDDGTQGTYRIVCSGTELTYKGIEEYEPNLTGDHKIGTKTSTFYISNSLLEKYIKEGSILIINKKIIKEPENKSKDLYLVKDGKVLTNHGMKEFSFTDNPEFAYRIEDIGFANRMKAQYKAQIVMGFELMKSEVENYVAPKAKPKKEASTNFKNLGKGKFLIDGKNFDISNDLFDVKHPIMVVDSDSSQFEAVVREYLTTKEKEAKKKAQPKPTKKVQSVVEKRYLDNYSTEFQLIKRFWNVIKDKQIVLVFRKARLLYSAFNRAAVERAVRKTSKDAEIFNACNQRMKKLFEEFMLPTQSDIKVDFENKALYDEIQDYVANVTIDPTVGVLKSFILMQNTLPEIKKAQTFLNKLKNTKAKFPKSRLSKELNDAIEALQDYVKNPKEPIEVESYGLSKPKVKFVQKKKAIEKVKNDPIKSVTIKFNSLKKKPKAVKKAVAKPVEKPKVVQKPVAVKMPVLMNKIKKPIVKLSSPVLPSVHVPRIDAGNIKTVGKIKSINDTGREQNKFFTVNGPVGQFLQQVERKPFESVVITLDGMQGAGKTTTLYKFIEAFASAGNSSLFISGEEHPESSLAIEKRDKYLSNTAKQNTAIVGDVESIEQLYQYVKPYDIIFIDSWQKLQRMVGAIRLDEDLRKKFNGKVFVVIFQQTTTGRTKGGAEVVFDGDIIIKMVKEASFADNYAYFDKNRYTRIPIENIRYNIASGEVYNPNEPEQPEQPEEQITETARPVTSSGFAFQT
jgi:hypothetical protein